jgi:hypothetical protein
VWRRSLPLEFPQREARRLRSPIAMLMLVTGESSPLIDCDVLEAVCQAITNTVYGPWNRYVWLFTFSIISPEKYLNQRVQMFVRYDKRWKYARESSKLFKSACVALGRRLYRGERITKSFWLKKAFRMRLRKVGEGAAAYSVVDKLLEKLTGLIGTFTFTCTHTFTVTNTCTHTGTNTSTDFCVCKR